MIKKALKKFESFLILRSFCVKCKVEADNRSILPFWTVLGKRMYQQYLFYSLGDNEW